MNKNNFFTNKLLLWNKTNQRTMPWKGEKDPYKIWLSEIILQQTRVAQGLSYYNNFIAQFPTITALANAKDETVFKLWEGLGYYSRCRNLLFTARLIATEMAGIFPTTYNDILKLKGVGPYTAAAIASFAYNIPVAVIDGNVYRLLSRFFGIQKPIDDAETKKEFALLANELINKKLPSIYNQAIMDFGATICIPKNPKCETCTLSDYCFAFKENKTSILPVKSKKVKISDRWISYLIIEYKNNYLVRQRTEKDIWQNLWEFVIANDEIDDPKNVNFAFLNNVEYIKNNNTQIYKQKLTHRILHINITPIKVFKKIKIENYEWRLKSDILKLAFPKTLNNYIIKYFE